MIDKTRILILGMHPIGASLTDRLKEVKCEIVMVNYDEIFRNPFEPEPFVLTAPEILPLIEVRDRKGNLFETPKSKYHK